MAAQNDTMKTLHLIQGQSHCGTLKLTLERPYNILWYPLPLSYAALPRSTSKTELQRVNREFRKIEPIFHYTKELEEFFHTDISQFDRVVIWWSNTFNPCAHLILHLVCRFYPQCELYQMRYEGEDFDETADYPNAIRPITPEERAKYAAEYDELLKNDTHLRVYADEQHQEIKSLPEDYYDKKILALCKKETSYLKICGKLLVKYHLDLWFMEGRIYQLHQMGKLQISDVEWFRDQFSMKNRYKNRALLTIKAL